METIKTIAVMIQFLLIIIYFVLLRIKNIDKSIIYFLIIVQAILLGFGIYIYVEYNRPPSWWGCQAAIKCDNDVDKYGERTCYYCSDFGDSCPENTYKKAKCHSNIEN